VAEARELAMRSALLLSFAFFSMNVWSTVTVAQLDCPTQFEGKVKEVMDEVGPSNPLSTQKVIFDNRATIRGNPADIVTLDVLKHGPFAIEAGEDYLVQMRGEKLCWIEKI
jgi:hypothetical protein